MDPLRFPFHQASPQAEPGPVALPVLLVQATVCKAYVLILGVVCTGTIRFAFVLNKFILLDHVPLDMSQRIPSQDASMCYSYHPYGMVDGRDRARITIYKWGRSIHQYYMVKKYRMMLLSLSTRRAIKNLVLYNYLSS